MTSSSVEEATRIFRTEQEALRCPAPIYARMREESPIAFVPELDAWVVSRYEDIDVIARDAVAFSNRNPVGPVIARGMHDALAALKRDAPDLADGLAMMIGGERVLVNCDPPNHTRQRSLVNEVFSPGRIRAMSPLITEWTDTLIDAFIDKGEAEIVSAFAIPLPLNVISDLLGVDKDHRERFKLWSDGFQSFIGNLGRGPEETRKSLLLQREFTDYFKVKVAERRDAPTEDLISFCMEGKVGEEPLSDGELLTTLAQFLVAGNETTGNLISAAVRHLVAAPERQEYLRENPKLIGKFIEEVLRLESPVQVMSRTANRDYEIGGVTIKEGDAVALWYASGNRDPERYEAPGTMDLDRPQARKHLAFGIGPHFCLGSPLARVEGVIAIERLLARVKDIRLPDGQTVDQLTWADDYHTRHVHEMDVVFSKV